MTDTRGYKCCRCHGYVDIGEPIPASAPRCPMTGRCEEEAAVEDTHPMFERDTAEVTNG